MSSARFILVILICLSPALLLWDGPIVHGLVAGVAAAAMVILAHAMRPGETAFFVSIARPVAALAIVPALWMVIQILPLGILAHPIWTSAQAALGHPIRGVMSIDIGAGVVALGRYLTMMAIAFWSAAVAVDRQRAEWILFSLMVATALVGLGVLAGVPSEPTVLSPGSTSLERMQAIDCAALGIIIAAAATVRTLERYETRHASPDRSVSVLMATFAGCLVSLLICIAAVALSAGGNVLIAAAYGAAALVSVIVIRRFGLGPWGVAGISALGLAVAVLLLANHLDLRGKSILFAFAPESLASQTPISQRILDDAPPVGTGAGSFAAIAPIYRDIDEQALPVTAPTTAAAIAIELGRPVLWFVIATVIGTMVFLFRAALERGRDSFYPMAGAACLLTLLLLCFVNAGLLGTATATIAAAVTGLALGQSKSRSVGQ